MEEILSSFWFYKKDESVHCERYYEVETNGFTCTPQWRRSDFIVVSLTECFISSDTPLFTVPSY